MTSTKILISLALSAFPCFLPTSGSAQDLDSLEEIDFATIFFASQLGLVGEQSTQLDVRINDLWSIAPHKMRRPSIAFLPARAIAMLPEKDEDFQAWSDRQILVRKQYPIDIATTFNEAFPLASKDAILGQIEFYESLRKDKSKHAGLRRLSTLVLTALDAKDLHDCCLIVAMIIMSENRDQDPAVHLVFLEGSNETMGVAFLLRLYWLLGHNCSRKDLSMQLKSMPVIDFTAPFTLPDGEPMKKRVLETKVMCPLMPFKDLLVSRVIQIELTERQILEDFRADEQLTLARDLRSAYVSGFAKLVKRREFSEENFYEEHSRELIRILGWTMCLDYCAKFAAASFLERADGLAFDAGLETELVAKELRTLPPITRHESLAFNQVQLVEIFRQYNEKARIILQILDKEK